MTARELRRWLKEQGCIFAEGKKHTWVILGDRKVMMPRHPAKGIKTGTLRAILRDLGLPPRKVK